MQNLSYENKLDLHENKPVGRTLWHTIGFALRLVLTLMQKSNRKWPISDFHITHNAFGFPHKILHKLLSSILKCI